MHCISLIIQVEGLFYLESCGFTGVGVDSGELDLLNIGDLDCGVGVEVGRSVMVVLGSSITVGVWLGRGVAVAKAFNTNAETLTPYWLNCPLTCNQLLSCSSCRVALTI